MLPLIHPSPLSREAAPLRLAAKAQFLLQSDPPPLCDLTAEPPPDIPTLIEPSPAPGCEHLRHIIIGSPTGVQHTIERLHLLQYVERRYWTPLITIGAQGIHITPAHGQVLSYPVRQRPIR